MARRERGEEELDYSFLREKRENIFSAKSSLRKKRARASKEEGKGRKIVFPFSPKERVGEGPPL